jgi:hypothetical protein
MGEPIVPIQEKFLFICQILKVLTDWLWFWGHVACSATIGMQYRQPASRVTWDSASVAFYHQDSCVAIKSIKSIPRLFCLHGYLLGTEEIHGAVGTCSALWIWRSILLLLSSWLGHFNVPMPSTGKPMPILFIFTLQPYWVWWNVLFLLKCMLMLQYQYIFVQNLLQNEPFN